MGALYKNQKSSDIKNAAPGYSPNAFITPLSFLDVIAEPVISATPVIGERVTIGTSHTYVAGKGSIAVYCPPNTVEGDGDMVGELLAHRFQWKPKIIIPGDSPELLDMVLSLINESFLLHVQDSANCLNGVHQFIQIGCDCDPCLVDTNSFKSGTTGTGRKQYEFVMSAYCKFFYNGVLTELP